MCIDKPSKAVVVQALEALVIIPRPSGDNENAAINSATVFDRLPEHNQRLVEAAEALAMAYTRKPSDEPQCAEEVDQRAITELNKAGYAAHLGPDQYDPYRLRGSIQVGNWELDISDPEQGHDI